MFETIFLILLFILVIGGAAAIVLITNQSPKRGYGHGCATCRNREFCHRRGKKKVG